MSYSPNKVLKLVCKAKVEIFANIGAQAIKKKFEFFPIQIFTTKFKLYLIPKQQHLQKFPPSLDRPILNLMGRIGHHNGHFDIKQYLVYGVSRQENPLCILNNVLLSRLTTLYTFSKISTLELLFCYILVCCKGSKKILGVKLIFCKKGIHSSLQYQIGFVR